MSCRIGLQNLFAASNYQQWEKLSGSDKGGNTVDILLSIPKALNQVQRRSLKFMQPKMQISVHVTTKL